MISDQHWFMQAPWGGGQAQTPVGGNATQVFTTFVKLTSVASMASDMCGLDFAKVLHACRY